MMVYILTGGAALLAFAVIVIFAAIAKKRRGLSVDAEFVRKMLPCIDCGMCGEQNCTEFAKKVAGGQKEPEACKLIKPENSEKIRNYFKPTYKGSSKLVAFVKCKGGCLAEDKYIYDGAKNCAVQERLHSGAKACKFACLGCGNCVHACKYGAIKITKRGVAQVSRHKCTGCGECVAACPNHVISRI